jgi:hypothetical protein
MRGIRYEHRTSVRQVADNLDKIITALEDDEPDDKGAAAGAL